MIRRNWKGDERIQDPRFLFEKLKSGGASIGPHLLWLPTYLSFQPEVQMVSTAVVGLLVLKMGDVACFLSNSPPMKTTFFFF